MAKRERGRLRLLCLAIVLVLLFPAMFMMLEADHDCSHEECHVCMEICACAKLLREMGMGLTGIAALGFACAAPAFLRRNLPAAITTTTLVSLKVKLSN